MSTTAPGETTRTPDAPGAPATLDAPAEPPASAEPLTPVTPAAPTEPAGLLTTGELARWASVAPATVRHYEDLGLLEPAARQPEPPRYAASAVGLVNVILLLRDVGFTPREMKELIDARSGSSRAWRDLAERKIVALDRQIATAKMARDALDHALRCEHDGIVDCPRFRAVVADHPESP